MDASDFFEVNSSFVVRVKTDAPKTRITKIEQDIVFLDVHAPAQDNKANLEIIKFFTRLTKKKARLIRGLTSKEKLVGLQ